MLEIIVGAVVMLTGIIVGWAMARAQQEQPDTPSKPTDPTP